MYYKNNNKIILIIRIGKSRAILEYIEYLDVPVPNSAPRGGGESYVSEVE